MELGADRRSLTRLGVLLAVLAVVVYLQFFSGPDGAVTPVARPSIDATQPQPSGEPARSVAGERHRPPANGNRGPVGGSGPDGHGGIRKELLDKVRSVTLPVIERDIFNFGRPESRPTMGPTREEMELAQARLERETASNAETEAEPAPAPSEVEPKAPRPDPPDWHYFGLADSPASGARRGLLRDDEEILVAAPGAILEDRYEVLRVGVEGIDFRDVEHGHDFSLQLQGER